MSESPMNRGDLRLFHPGDDVPSWLQRVDGCKSFTFKARVAVYLDESGQFHISQIGPGDALMHFVGTGGKGSIQGQGVGGVVLYGVDAAVTNRLLDIAIARLLDIRWWTAFAGGMLAGAGILWSLWR